LAIGYNGLIAAPFLPGICAPLLAAHSEVSLRFTEADNAPVQEGLIEGRFDGIIFGAELPNL